jgi:hypothetical protein
MTDPAGSSKPGAANWALVAIAWTLVGVPLAWGVFMTFKKALPLFH